MSANRRPLRKLDDRLLREQDELLARRAESRYRPSPQRRRRLRSTIDDLAHAHEPGTRWWRFGRALAAVAAVTAAVVLWQKAHWQRATECNDENAPARAWNDHVRGRVRTAFDHAGVAYAADTFDRVATMLDRYAGALASMRAGACEAARGRVEASPAMNLKMQCLDRRGAKLAALVSVFSGPLEPDVIERAIEATSGLDDLATCSNLYIKIGDAPSDTQAREQVATLQTRIDRIWSLERAGLYRRGLEIAPSIVADARVLGHASIDAEANVVVARLQKDVGEYNAAEASLRAAARAAATAHDDELSAVVETDLFELVGFTMGRHAEGLVLRDAADRAVLRAGDVPSMRARLQSREAEVLQESGRREDALVAAERAVASWQQVGTNGGVELVHAYLSHARILGGLERWEEAQRSAERALALNQDLFGRAHPEVGRSYKYIGDFLMMRGRYSEAHPYYEQAIAIAESSVGHVSNDIRGAYNGLASVLHHTDHLEDAISYYGEALGIDARLFGPESSGGQALRLNMADTLRALGRDGEARAMCEQARSSLEFSLTVGRGNPINLPVALDCLGRLDMDKRWYGSAIARFQRALTLDAGSDDRPSHSSMLVHLAQAYLATGRAAEALPLLLHAVTVFDAVECDTGDRGDAHFALAQALWATDTDRARALARAEQARDEYVRAGAAKQKELVAAVAWLSKRKT